jgi:cation:H+ antiporter
MIFIYILIFLISLIILYISSELVIKGLNEIAKFLELREFVIAFFIMAFASSLPNLFVGITSALHKIPQLSLGDIMGGNVINLTLAVALSVLFSKNKEISTDSRMVQNSSVFTIIAAILPLLLMIDGNISRTDGFLLICFFLFYVFWLFSKQERFTKTYNNDLEEPIIKEFKSFLKDISKIILGLIFFIFSAQGIVFSSKFFAEKFNMPLALIGILIVGLGNSLPEIYFAVSSAKKNETWMILGDLMGSVIFPATLILGIVALIFPIEILNFSSIIIARLFLIIAAIFFFFFIKTHHKITKQESIVLLLIFIIFILIEILTK